LISLAATDATAVTRFCLVLCGAAEVEHFWSAFAIGFLKAAYSHEDTAWNPKAGISGA
jgi:hypothetical protein